MESKTFDVLKEWRVGGSVGCTIYAMEGKTATKSDRLIGVMDNRELAAHAVKAHNLLLDLADRMNA